MFYETCIVQNLILLKIIILIPDRWIVLIDKIYEKNRNFNDNDK